MSLKWSTGLSPEPVRDTERIAETIFGRLAELSRKHGSKLVVVSWPREQNAMLEALPDALVVYPLRRLFDRLDVGTEEEFSRVYRHWAGSPPVRVDTHPNPLAHSLIAEEIVASIRATQARDRRQAGEAVRIGVERRTEGSP